MISYTPILYSVLCYCVGVCVAACNFEWEYKLLLFITVDQTAGACLGDDVRMHYHSLLSISTNLYNIQHCVTTVEQICHITGIASCVCRFVGQSTMRTVYIRVCRYVPRFFPPSMSPLPMPMVVCILNRLSEHPCTRVYVPHPHQYVPIGLCACMYFLRCVLFTKTTENIIARRGVCIRRQKAQVLHVYWCFWYERLDWKALFHSTYTHNAHRTSHIVHTHKQRSVGKENLCHQQQHLSCAFLS